MLGIRDVQLFEQDYVAAMVNPYIDHAGKPRLIEAPHSELKTVQGRIKGLLGKIEVPGNVFSGIKGRSYADNARLHIGGRCRYLFKIDLTAFFPSIRRNTVYHFFSDDLCCSPDVANILANLTTFDLKKDSARNHSEIEQFLCSKKVKCYNHLISGSPASQILSYLVNHRMFDEMQALADEYKTTMSVYVDDVTFSSECYISPQFRKAIYSIIRKYGYHISRKKVKFYSKLYPKLITGVIIDATGRMTLKNSLRKKIIVEHLRLRSDPADRECRNKLRGLVTAARQVDKSAYPNIHQFAFSKPPIL